MLFELLYGFTPFYVANGGFQAIKRRIKDGIFTFPKKPQTSPEAKDLILKLLVTQVDKRLGYRFGAAELKKHKFFKTFNFAVIGSPLNLIEYSTAEPAKNFKELPHASEHTARDLAGTAFDVPPRIRIFYKQVE